jgi:hypothetical protein
LRRLIGFGPPTGHQCRIDDNADRGKGHGRSGKDRRQDAESCERDADEVVDEGPAEILPDCPSGFRRDIECGWNQTQVGPHQGDRRGFTRGICSAGHGDAEIGGSQGRRIVQAVADKGDMAAGPIRQFANGVKFLGRQKACPDVQDTGKLRYGLRRGLDCRR